MQKALQYLIARAIVNQKQKQKSRQHKTIQEMPNRKSKQMPDLKSR